jgi:hypothetical protein
MQVLPKKKLVELLLLLAPYEARPPSTNVLLRTSSSPHSATSDKIDPGGERGPAAFSGSAEKRGR